MVKIKETSQYIAPVLKEPDLEEQVRRAMKKGEVKKLMKEYKGPPENFKQMLRDYVQRENEKNYRLFKIAGSLDTANKSLIPVDAGLDAFNILAGVGYAARGIITLAKLPIYLAYNTYYAGKTHDIAGTIKNIGYEGASWLCPGSLPHLINHYTNQAEKYAEKKGTERFVESVKKRSLEKKVIKLEERKKSKKYSEDLEELAEAA